LHDRNDSRIELTLADENATLELACRIAAQLQAGMVIYLHGDLGTGKTCLVRGVLNSLGYRRRVKSPTYTLLEPYNAGGFELRHFDLYRLQDESEWESAGFRDEFDSHNILFIEWPEKAQAFIPSADMTITLEFLAQGRVATISGHTSIGRACLQQL
jgi:tRNA threonylcarbamoyladenosine biosynthesis protein TsaE